MTTKISFRGVGKSYPMKGTSFTALDRVTLDIEDREFVTVVGPSGCGKSTLLGMAAGLVEPTVGSVMVDGAPVTGPGPDRGVIFQQYALFPWLTVRRNVEFGLRLTSIPAAERKRRAQHAIEQVGLADFADALPKTLSGGMKQRCAIARAYAVDPEVLLMDEPFGALDAVTRVQLQDQLLATWSRERRTVLFVTHDVDEAVYLARRVVVMAARPGRVHHVVDVDLPYPRTEEIRLSPAFARIRNEVWQSVYHQEKTDADQRTDDHQRTGDHQKTHDDQKTDHRQKTDHPHEKPDHPHENPDSPREKAEPATPRPGATGTA